MKRSLSFLSLLLASVLVVSSSSAQDVITTRTVEDRLASAEEVSASLSSLAPDGRWVVGDQVFGEATYNGPDEMDALPPDAAAEALANRRRWKVFSHNIERALASGHEGLQTSAMRHIIYYGHKVDIGEEAVFDVMRLYRNHDNERVRRMAVVTLSQTNSRWAMRFLERAVRFEKSPALKHTIQAVLADYNQSKSAS